MIDFLNSHYEWLLAGHIISVISWMAGMLYLPRLFVYHAMSKPGSEQSETFKIMERKLYKYIMNPAMYSSWLFGLLMLYARWDMFLSFNWMYVKLAGVLLMTAIHYYFIKHLEEFADDKNTKSHVYFRVLNEVPTVIMIIIVIVAVTKSF